MNFSSCCFALYRPDALKRQLVSIKYEKIKIIIPKTHPRLKWFIHISYTSVQRYNDKQEVESCHASCVTDGSADVGVDLKTLQSLFYLPPSNLKAQRPRFSSNPMVGK